MFAPLLPKPQTTAVTSLPSSSLLARSAPLAPHADAKMIEPTRRQPSIPTWDFSKTPILPRSPENNRHCPASILPGRIQAKLKIGVADDPLEHEAERAADLMMREPGRQISTHRVPAARGASARSALRRAATVASPQTLAVEAPEIVHKALRAPGKPLDPTIRDTMESSYGHDFSHVRVHDGADANASASAMGALAYTVGHNMVYGPGEYAPHTARGKRLIAHELAHVVQQGTRATHQAETDEPGSGAQHGSGITHRAEPQVQRFTEPGHKLLGDTAFGTELLNLGGVQMSFGDAVALGDYFGSFDSLRRFAEKEGIGRNSKGVLRYVIWVKIRKHPMESKLNDWYNKDAVFQAEQISRSLDPVNIGHFPNPKSGDTKLDPLQKNQRVDENKKPFGAAATYRQAHEQAMELAYFNGVHQQSNDDALIADGFACHFLTDSFSASHLRTPRASIKAYWDQKVPGFQNKLIQWLADIINRQPLSSVGLVNLAERGLAPFVAGGTVRGTAISTLSLLLSGGQLNFGDLVSLIVHDAEGAAGVEATIGGKNITLVGDKDLLDEKPADDLDPGGEKISSLKQAGAAAETAQAAIAAVKASLEDIYDAYFAGLPENLGTIGLGYAGFGDLSRTTHHKDFATYRKDALGRRNLYRAESLVPTAVEDAQLPAEKATLPWMQNSVADLFAEPRIKKALVVFGKGEATEFAERLKGMKDLRPEHLAAINKALIEPLASGDPDRVAGVIESIISGADASLQVGPQGVEKRQPNSGSGVRITLGSKRYDL